MKIKQYSTSTAGIYKENNIIYCTVYSNDFIGLDEVEEIIEIFKAIMDGKEILLFLDIRKIRHISIDAKYYLMRKENAVLFKAISVVAATPAAKSAVYSVLSYIEPMIHFKIFDPQNKKEAFNWLCKFAESS